MAAHKKHFVAGALLMAAFAAVLAVMFSPVFDGRNGLDALDALYNSISKGSAYYIPDLREKADAFAGKEVAAALEFKNEEQASLAAALFQRSGSVAAVAAGRLELTGDLGRILATCLEDSEDMFDNNGAALEARYGAEPRRALYTWWAALGSLEKALQKQKSFPEARAVADVNKRAVECSYNYFGIEPQRISEQIVIVLASLVFYVVYTVWYGFAILFMFEGSGLKLSH